MFVIHNLFRIHFDIISKWNKFSSSVSGFHCSTFLFNTFHSGLNSISFSIYYVYLSFLSFNVPVCLFPLFVFHFLSPEPLLPLSSFYFSFLLPSLPSSLTLFPSLPSSLTLSLHPSLPSSLTLSLFIFTLFPSSHTTRSIHLPLFWPFISIPSSLASPRVPLKIPFLPESIKLSHLGFRRPCVPLVVMRTSTTTRCTRRKISLKTNEIVPLVAVSETILGRRLEGGTRVVLGS